MRDDARLVGAVAPSVAASVAARRLLPQDVDDTECFVRLLDPTRVALRPVEAYFNTPYNLSSKPRSIIYVISLLG